MNQPQRLGLEQGGALERERDHICVVAMERQSQSRVWRKYIAIDGQLYSVRGLATPKCEIRRVTQTMLMSYPIQYRGLMLVPIEMRCA